MSVKLISKEEVAKHNTEDDLWIIINHRVYDITKFQRLHPGGKIVFKGLGGTDCTKQFYALHSERELQKLGPKLLIGQVEGETPLAIQQASTVSFVLMARRNQ